MNRSQLILALMQRSASTAHAGVTCLRWRNLTALCFALCACAPDGTGHASRDSSAAIGMSALQPATIVAIDSTIPPAIAGKDGWNYQQSVSRDLNGDGRAERVVITAKVEMYRGQPAWDDGQPWQVYVEDESGARTYLYARRLQLGTLKMRVTQPDSTGKTNIVMLEELPDRLSVYEAWYSGISRSRVVLSLERNLDATGDTARSPSAPAAEPGGEKGPASIAFASRRDGNWEIYATDPDGRNERRLTNRDVQERFPMWSPDRSQLVFVAEPEETKELWVMSATGGSPRRLATGIIGKASRQWFPDGRRLVVTAIVGTDTVIAIVDATATVPMQRLTTVKGEHRDPSLSPDGRMIAFSSNRDGNREIYVMRADGSDQRRLTNHAAADGSPSWSPDGATIAFVSNRDNSKDVYRISPDGQGLVRLTTGANSTNDLPQWSPDGTRLAIQMARGTNYDIGVLTIADKRLIDVAATPEYDGSFTWSPDSRMIAFISGPRDAEALHVVSNDGRGMRRLTTTTALTPNWTR